MFQRGRKPMREPYDEHYMRNPGNGREVTFHRVVNVVERRSPMSLMGGDCDRRVDGPMYNEPMPFMDARDFQGNNNFPQNDMPFFENDERRFGHFRRNPPLSRNDGQPSHFVHNRDDLRHHLETRNNGRGGNFFSNRGREPVREDSDYRRREPYESYSFVRDRSPVRRSHSSSSGPRSTEKTPTQVSNQAKPKPSAPASPPPSASPKEEPPLSATTPEENPPESVTEPKEEEEDPATVEPEPTSELDLKTRRLEAIKAKALEIEKDYRQDCETFRTVVKMLVEKEPSLDYLLQAPLEKNLEEIKGRCLDSLKQFIKELDEAIEPPGSTDQPTEGAT